MKRKQLHDSTHLTLEERKIIQAGIENFHPKHPLREQLGKMQQLLPKK